MRKIAAPLRRVLLRTWFRELLHRALVWLASSVIALCLGTALCLTLSPPKRIYTALILGLASLLPVFLAWPVGEKRLRTALRAADEETVIEAWLEAPEGPARELLARRAASRLEALDYMPPSRRGAFRGLGRLSLAAVLALTILELGSLILLKRPILVYPGPKAVAGSGLRIEESYLASNGESDPAALLAARENFQEAEGGKGEGSGPAGGSAGAESRSPAHRGEEEGVDFEIPQTGEGGTGMADPGSQAGARRAVDRGEEGEGAGLGVEGEGDEKTGESRRTGLDRRATGFENGGDTGVPSPLVDYRARFFKVLAERTKKEARASGELSLGELRDFERRYFASFSLSAGLGPLEEAYAALLKRRWKALLEEHK